MIVRDAVREAVRELLLPTAALAAFAWLALPLVASSGVMVKERAVLDGVLAVIWLLSVASGLRLGTRLHGQGLAPLLSPALGVRRYLGLRLVGHGCVLAAQAGAMAATALVHGAVRAAGPTLAVHAAACAGEALLALLVTALLATWARPWLGATAAGALLLIGHLEQELLGALEGSGVRGAAQGLLLLVPSLERLDVQGALLRGDAVPLLQLGLGAVELIGWCTVLTLALWASVRRHDLR